MKQNIKIVPATIEAYPIIQNMARFYLYDMTRYCAVISDEWNIPKDGLYECFDFKEYFTDPTKKAFFVKVDYVVAGFVLLDKECKSKSSEWNIGEFFILAQFQGQGIGEYVASEIWDMYPGIWEVSVIPENTKALAFWRQAIANFTQGNYHEEIKVIDFDEHQPKRYILTFDTKIHARSKSNINITPAITDDIDAMVALSYKKRISYEKSQPQFWKYAEGAEGVQTNWFLELLDRDEYIMLVAKSNSAVVGFIIGRVIPCPEVYAAGLTLLIDDFCVEVPYLWKSAGAMLVDDIKSRSKSKNVEQIVVVCGKHDEFKRSFLKTVGLSMASEWYVGEI
jgi:predicted acetyltransferase